MVDLSKSDSGSAPACMCVSTPASSVYPRDTEVQPEAPIKALEKHPCIGECKPKISYCMKYKAVI